MQDLQESGLLHQLVGGPQGEAPPLVFLQVHVWRELGALGWLDEGWEMSGEEAPPGAVDDLRDIVPDAYIILVQLVVVLLDLLQACPKAQEGQSAQKDNYRYLYHKGIDFIFNIFNLIY